MCQYNNDLQHDVRIESFRIVSYTYYACDM